MFSFFKDSKTLSVVDMHSHLVPGIDDGASDMEESLGLIQELYLLGYKKLIITPHVSDMFPNNKRDILDRYNLLKEEIIKKEIDIETEIGAEYYIDDSFLKLLESEELLSFGEENYILFEFSYFTAPRDVENLIYDIFLKGYKPILAHPERYLYWHSNFKKYKELKDMGVLFQINLNSLNGYYGKEVQSIVEQFIKNKMVDFVGSDTHHMTHIKSLKRVLSSSLYKKAFKNNNILNETLL